MNTPKKKKKDNKVEKEDVQLTWAATAIAVMKTPSTPKGVKKVCRLRVSLNGTGSLRSNTPLYQRGNLLSQG